MANNDPHFPPGCGSCDYDDTGVINGGNFYCTDLYTGSPASIEACCDCTDGSICGALGSHAGGVCCDRGVTGVNACVSGGLCETAAGVITTTSCVNNQCPDSSCIDVAGSGYYLTNLDWEPPQELCVGDTYRPNTCTDYDCICGDSDILAPNIAPNNECDWCAITPKITNIEVNGKTAGEIIVGDSFVNFTFNSNVDSQQLPLIAYYVDWGDDEITSVTGIKMRDRPNEENPHSLYHLYSYWDLVYKNNTGGTSINCFSAAIDYCEVTPRVKIRDNWDWCNKSSDPNDCDNPVNWEEYGSSAVPASMTATIRVYQN